MRYLYIYVFILFFSINSFSQGSMFGMSYQMALPVGSTSDYISTFSGRGFGIDYKAFVSPEVAVGGSIGWNVFYEAIPEETYEFNDGTNALTGKQWRYINSFPFLLTVDYFFGDYGDPRFFVGGGIGAYRIYQRIDMGIFTSEPREWAFGLAPQVGVAVPLNRDAYFLGSVRFNYAFASGDLKDPTTYIGINLGFAWN
jgi:outer membrane protein W